MIKINLLPPELQEARKTPKPLLYAGIAVMLLVLASAIAYLYLWINLAVLKQEKAELQRACAQLERKVRERQSLLEDLQDYKEREKSIVQIKTARVLWSRKLDYLVTLTPEKIWITRLRLAKSKDGKIGSGKIDKDNPGYLELECYALGTDVAIMTEFRRRLMGEKPFWKNFLSEPLSPEDFSYGFSSISQPSWNIVELKGFRKPKNIRFTIRFNLEKRELKAEESSSHKTG